MKTPFDFASVALFALLAVVYLHRSAQADADRAPLWAYALVALACAAGDVAANHGQVGAGGLLLLAASAGTAWIVARRPARPGSGR